LIIGCGLLLDTFLVRTLTVPAIATLLREASWWPQRATHRPTTTSHSTPPQLATRH
ncbi:MMPL family transporter, partial [Mycobacterium avium]